jgi:hypothetical protein
VAQPEAARPDFTLSRVAFPAQTKRGANTPISIARTRLWKGKLHAESCPKLAGTRTESGVAGIGMRYAKSDGNDVDARSRDRTKFPGAVRPNKCVCRDCARPVTFRTGYEHPKNRKWVNAIFRLPGNQQHVDGCAYDVRATLESAARGAENLENSQGNRLLEKLGAHSFQSRLKSLGDAFGIPVVPSNQNGVQSENRRSYRAHDSKRLPPYIVLARGLANLYHRLHDELEDDAFETLLHID